MLSIDSTHRVLIISLLLFSVSACFNHDANDNPTDFTYSARLKSFDSCDQLKTSLIATALKEQQLRNYYQTSVTLLESFDQSAILAPVEMSNGSESVTSSDTAIGSFTGTNNQVLGVDEADFVKTTGEHTFIISGGYLLIFDSWPAAETTEDARLKLEGEPVELLIHNDIVLLISRIYKSGLTPQAALITDRYYVNTRISLIDVSDLTNPQLIRETDVEADYITARKVGQFAYLVTSAYFDLYPFIQDADAVKMEDVIPLLRDDNLLDSAQPSLGPISECAETFQPETENGTGTVTILSFDLDNPQQAIQRQTLLSSSGLVYANQQSLYIASTENYFWQWLPVIEGDRAPKPGTTLHKFSLGAKPQYQASGRVNGFVLNQFSMDEHNDLFRLATTEHNWWANAAPINSLFILQQIGMDLTIRSQLDGLGKPGERIYSARFMQDKGFIVTFQQTDPLYTLDLTDPDQPRIAGELEIPGFSTYLHPIGDDLLLAIGRSADASNTLDLSLFDFSAFDNPILLDRQSVGVDGYSLAEYEHKAFTWFPEQKLLALPVMYWDSSFRFDTANSYSSDVVSGLKVYSVDKTNGFEALGTVNHSNFFFDPLEQSWFYPSQVKRSFFIRGEGEQQQSYLYSISDRGLKVNSSDSLDIDLVSLPLPAQYWPIATD